MRPCDLLRPGGVVGGHDDGAAIGGDLGHGDQRQALQPALGTEEVLDEPARRLRQDALGGVELLQDAALGKDRDPVAHRDGLIDVVGDEDDGLAHLGLETQELLLEAAPDERVDGAEGLVHQHDGRVDRQGAGDADALPLPAGQLVRVAVGDRCGQADGGDELLDAIGRPLLLPAQQLGHRRDVLRGGAVREQADLLDDVADRAPQLRCRHGHDVAAIDRDRAAGRLDHAVDHPHRRRLAAAAGAHEDHDLALRHLEVELVDRHRPVGEALRHAVEGDHRWCS